jgi:NADH-quinone oxidoreductase subunit M
MPAWSGYFVLFMFASIGLPGLSGFVGEFLVALGTWDYNPWAAVITFTVVIFAAWYMLWLVQRVVFERAFGQEPDPGDTELTAAERAEIAAHGGDREGGEHGHAAPLPVSGGSHAAGTHDAHTATAGATHEGQMDSSTWPDLTVKEALTLAPLAVLTIVTGIYPKPIFDIVEPSFQAILEGTMRVVAN